VTPLGALAARRKPLQDSPTPAGNPTAASALLRLEALSGRQEYRDIAEDTLANFAGIVEHFGLYAGSYGLALERLLLDPVQVVIGGSGPEAARLEATAMARFGGEQDGDAHCSRELGCRGNSRGWRRRCCRCLRRLERRPGRWSAGAHLPAADLECRRVVEGA
jgi:hypothetical protein